MKLCLRKPRSRKSHDNCHVVVLEKVFFTMFTSTLSQRCQISPVKSFVFVTISVNGIPKKTAFSNFSSTAWTDLNTLEFCSATISFSQQCTQGCFCLAL